MSQSIPTVDPAFREVLENLNNVITEEHVEALRKCLRLRKLRKAWDREVGAMPTPGESWLWWLGHRGVASAAVRFLAEAGVLGANWNSDAQAAVFSRLGWT